MNLESERPSAALRILGVSGIFFSSKLNFDIRKWRWWRMNGLCLVLDFFEKFRTEYLNAPHRV